MSPRSLFIILIKLFGINIILQALGLIVPMLSALFTPGFDELEGEYIAYTILGILFFILIFGVAINYCIFKPEWIIDKLDLDKGFVEEKFELNIHTSTILRIATIVAGMLILIEGIPNLFRFGFELIETRQSFQDNKPYSPGWILFSFAKTLIGLLMVSSNRRIVSFIESKRRSR